MKFSAFARFSSGFRFSSKPTHGETIYRAMRDALGGALSSEPGSHDEARLFADAMMYARARYTAERCANNMFGRTALELLPVLERKLGIVPNPHSTILERQAIVAARQELPKGNTDAAVTAALTAAIGSDFVDYRTTTAGEIVSYPADPSAGPGHWVRPNWPEKVVRLTKPVTTLGSATAHYEPAVDGELVDIDIGDEIVVSASNIGLAELVTVTGVASRMFSAVFTKAHDAGDLCTTGSFPYWISTQRHSLVIITPAAALDPEKRRKANRVMAEVARGSATWDLVPTGASGAAAFVTDDPVLGVTDYAPTGPAVSY